MLFNSLHFLAFYVVVLIAYFALPHRARWPLLLAASYYFYAWWSPKYALLLVGLTAVGYVLGLLMDAASSNAARRAWFVLGIASCVGLLVFFKYIDFLLGSTAWALAGVGVDWQAPVYRILIPVGISFHTFQSMGYLIDVYQKKFPAERHAGIYALFIVFFPQLLAGPIERSGHMLPQFHHRHTFSYDRASSGFRWVIWGLFKKMVVADLLSPFVNTVYAAPHAVSGTVLLIATIFFAIQIYCDFSGYSDIAVGVARVMGYDLLINFRQPYLSRSISEFWSRWHISLSTWFRDYVYIPLGGSRVSKLRWATNVLIVFLISGLWHGASVLFVLWGLLHGTYLLLERAILPPVAKALDRVGLRESSPVRAYGGGAIVFALVVFAWVPFRAQSVADAGYIMTHMLRVRCIPLDTLYGFGLPRFEFALAVVAIGVLFLAELLMRSEARWIGAVWARTPVRWAAYVAAAYAIVFFGVFDKIEFIYFQF